MNKTEPNSFSSVISINPYTESYYTGVSSFITETTTPEFSKDQFAISYLNTNDFITAQIEISKNIPDDDLFDAINSKIYDDLGLDNAIEYKLQYIESFNNLDEDNRYFHVFIIDPLNITETYSSVIDKIKYLDVIIPAPLLLKSLFTKEIIEGSGTYCFIYLQENNAFITIYNNQEFVYTKSIKYSLLEMHERFCELYGERIEYYDFLNFFSKESLRYTTSNYKEFFLKLYKELFANINDILTYAKRAFELDKIEQVYIGSEVSTVTKLDEILEVELNVKTANFEFDYGFEHNDTYIDQLQSLMHLYVTLPEDEKYLCNFSTFNRPPKFIKRDSGKLLMLIAASLALAFAYPITYWILTYAQALQRDLLQKEYHDLHIVKTTRVATIKNKLADKTKAIAYLNQEKSEYIKKKNTLVEIHKVKVDYPMKAKLLAELTKDFNKYNVGLEAVNYSETENTKVFTFNLLTSKDRQMTELVEYLTKVHENRFKFSLDNIIYDEKARRYFGELKVEIL